MSFFNGLIDPIKNQLLQFALGPQSALSPVQQLGTAQAEYERIRDAAAGGSVSAIQQLPGAAQTYLGIAQEYYARGPQYAEIFRQVNQSLSDVMSSIQAQQAANFADLSLTVKDTIEDQTKQMAERMDQTNRSLKLIIDKLDLLKRAA